MGQNLMKKIEVKKTYGNIPGLKWIPSVPGRNDEDAFPETFKTKKPPREFTDRDQDILRKKLLGMDHCRCIVEIGVCRTKYPLSSSSILIENKSDFGYYLGIDIENRSFLDNINKKIYTFRMNSIEKFKFFNIMDSLNIREIDFLFIDGVHSINMVLNDWEYTERLSPHGIIGFHDTNVHPGPYFVFDALDEKMYKKEKYFEDLNDDWGISFATKI